MAPTFPCPRSHSALVHSSRQTDGGPSSCTSSSSARTSLETPTLSYVPSLSFLPPSIYLSVSFSSSLSSRQKRALALLPSFSLSFAPICMCSLSVLLSSSSCAHALAVLLSFYYYAPRAGQRRLSVPKLHRLFQPNISISHNSDITHARGKMSPARIINLLSAGSKKIER